MIDVSTLITSMTAWVNAVTGNNHFMAAALVTGAMIFARNLPKQLYAFICYHLFYVVNLTDSYDQNGASFTVRSLFQWHSKSRWARYSKTAQLRDTGNSLEERMITGIGRHFFMHKGVLFWMTVSLHEPKSGQQGEVNRVTIKTFIWNRNNIKDILLDIYPVNFDKPPIYSTDMSMGYGGNGQVTEIGRIDDLYGLQKQMIDTDQYNEIDKIINRFVNDPDWYVKNFVKYKEAFMLYGEPGTGKSTLVRHFASRYNIPIIICSTSSLGIIRQWLLNRKNPVILLMEDIDNSSYLCTEGKEEEDENREPMGFGYRPQTSLKNDRSMFLNFFDGVSPLERTLVFMTTNHIEKIHTSVYRPGRVDHLFNIGYPTPEKIADILEWDIFDPRMNAIRRCNLKDFPLAILANLKRADTVEEVEALLSKGKEYFALENVSGVKYLNSKTLTGEHV